MGLAGTEKKSEKFNFDPYVYTDLIKNETCMTKDELVRVQVTEIRKNETFDHCVTLIQLYRSGGRNPEYQLGTDITNQTKDFKVTQSQFDIVYPQGDSGLKIDLKNVRKDDLTECPEPPLPPAPEPEPAPADQSNNKLIGIIAAAAVAVEWRS